MVLVKIKWNNTRENFAQGLITIGNSYIERKDCSCYYKLILVLGYLPILKCKPIKCKLLPFYIIPEERPQNHPVNYSGISNCLVMSPLRFGALSALGPRRGASTLLEEEAASESSTKLNFPGDWQKEASFPLSPEASSYEVIRGLVLSGN